jgi:t-SNARE complex subunit (syntaxin)
MNQEVHKQGANIDSLETHVKTAKENVDKADKEIVEAEKISRSMSRKTKWIIFIGIFVALAVIGTVVGILLSRSTNK